MKLFDESKTILENLNLLSGPVVAILGFSVIIQLWLAKKAITVTSKRQAAEFASKQVDFYAHNIITIQDKLFIIEKEQQYKREPFRNLYNFTYSELANIINDSQKLLKISENCKQNLSETAKILNAMEAFSIYFTKGVADEEIAYSSIRNTFCDSVELYALEICLLRESDNQSGLNNLIKLYNIWNERIKLQTNTQRNNWLPVWI